MIYAIAFRDDWVLKLFEMSLFPLHPFFCIQPNSIHTCITRIETLMFAKLFILLSILLFKCFSTFSVLYFSWFMSNFRSLTMYSVLSVCIYYSPLAVTVPVVYACCNTVHILYALRIILSMFSQCLPFPEDGQGPQGPLLRFYPGFVFLTCS